MSGSNLPIQTTRTSSMGAPVIPDRPWGLDHSLVERIRSQEDTFLRQEPTRSTFSYTSLPLIGDEDPVDAYIQRCFKGNLEQFAAQAKAGPTSELKTGFLQESRIVGAVDVGYFLPPKGKLLVKPDTDFLPTSNEVERHQHNRYEEVAQTWLIPLLQEAALPNPEPVVLENGG